MKFSTKLSLVFSIIILISGVAISYIVYTSNIRVLEDHIKDRLQNQAFHTMDKINRMIFERYATIRVIATDPVISSRKSTPGQITQRLLEYKNNYRAYASLSFFDLNRIRIADTEGRDIGKQHSLTEYWKALKEVGDIVSGIYVAESLKKQVFYFISPVRDRKGVTFGYISSRIIIESLQDIVKQAVGIYSVERDFNVELLDKDGFVIYSNQKADVMLKKVSSDWNVLKKSLEAGAKTGAIKFTNPAENKGEEILVFAQQQGYLDYKGNEWTLIIEAPTSIVFASAIELRNRILIISLAIALFNIPIIFLFSHRISKTVKNLSNASLEVSKGNLDVRVESRSKDEIGQLAVVFNRMIKDLRDHQAVLENKVAERTAELENELIERKKSDEVLEESEARYRTLVETSPYSIVLADLNGNITFCNQQTLRSHGFDRLEDIIGTSCFDLFAPEDRQRAIDSAQQTMVNGGFRNVEYTLIRKDGSQFPAEASASLIVDSEGKPKGFVGVLWDITERKQMEEVLRNIAQGFSAETAQAFFQALVQYLAKTLNVAYAFVGEMDDKENRTVRTIAVCADGNIVDNFVYDLGNTPCENVVGKRPCSYPQNVREQFPYDQMLKEMMAESYIGTPLFDSKGHPSGIIVVLDRNPLSNIHFAEYVLQILSIRASHEIERMHAERFRAFLANITEHATDAIVGLDLDTNIILWNRGAKMLFGYSAEEIIGKPWSQIVPEEELEACRERFKKATIEGFVKTTETMRVAKGDRQFPAEMTLTALRDENGEHIGFISIARDITERKLAEEKLQESKDRFHSLVQTTVDAIISANKLGNIILWNNGARAIFGYAEEEVLGKSLTILMPERYRESHEEGLNRVSSTGESCVMGKTIEVYGLRKDSSEFPLELSLATYKVGNDVFYTGVIRDITVRKQVEKILREYNETLNDEVKKRTSELENAKIQADAANRTKSEFLANMSHELRTPLNSIIGFSELLFQRMAGDMTDQQKEYIRDIYDSGRHLLSMINDILELSRLDIGEIEITPKEFNLREMLEGSLEIFKVKALKQSIKTALDVESGIETIIADERVIKQVATHLLSNAYKFTPEGGSISMQARRVHKRDVVARSPDSRDDEAISKDEIATPEPALSDNARLLRFARNDKSEGARNDSLGDFIEISVSDTGIGISEEDQKRLFTPFEQLEHVYTKRYGGTGLGLYFSKRLVELHGGRIFVGSRVGEGSKFTFIIPLKE